MSEVHTDPWMELVARKLFGIEGVPKDEQTRMVQRCARAVMDKAATLEARIAEREAKIRELREVLEMLPHETGATVRQDAERVIELVAQLRAENRRLREVLEGAVMFCDNLIGYGATIPDEFDEGQGAMLDDARAALEDTKE